MNNLSKIIPHGGTKIVNLRKKSPTQPTQGELVLVAVEPQKKKLYDIPLYWLTNKDPYNGLL